MSKLDFNTSKYRINNCLNLIIKNVEIMDDFSTNHCFIFEMLDFHVHPLISLKIYYFCLLEEDKELVHEVFNNAIDVLSEEDKKLPQVRNF